MPESDFAHKTAAFAVINYCFQRPIRLDILLVMAESAMRKEAKCYERNSFLRNSTLANFLVKALMLKVDLAVLTKYFTSLFPDQPIYDALSLYSAIKLSTLCNQLHRNFEFVIQSDFDEHIDSLAKPQFSNQDVSEIRIAIESLYKQYIYSPNTTGTYTFSLFGTNIELSYVDPASKQSHAILTGNKSTYHYEKSQETTNLLEEKDSTSTCCNIV